jgi:hypothetical protein
MRISIAFSILILAPALSTGCANVQQLRKERDVLAAELSVKKDRITVLDGQVDMLAGVNRALTREKNARVKETTEVRREVRDFVRQQVGAIQTFSQSHKLLDYIGGELIQREHSAGKSPCRIDMKNRIAAGTQLTGGGVYLTGPSKFSFCILRPVTDGLQVVWMSRTFANSQPGLVRVTFASPIGAAKGDIIGLYSDAALQVPYDVGTGDTRTVMQKPKVGLAVRRSALKGDENRAYSFGVVGFLGN